MHGGPGLKFFFAGHSTFGNRGCEALIRSTVGLLRAQLPQARFVVPSSAIELDRRQWPQAESLGVEFTAPPLFPATLKWWNRVVRVLPPLERMLVPHYRMDAAALGVLEDCDAMIMSGGDVISLDYGLASMYTWTGYAENAMQLGKPVALWAGSVGPFKRKPHVEAFAAEHLRRYRSISVREADSQAYLASIGVAAEQVADPAFTMQPEAFDAAAFWPEGADGCLGLNVSPLIRGYRTTEASRLQLDAEVVAFVQAVARDTDLGVLLIPHVGPLCGGSDNSDHHYMQGLLQAGRIDSTRVRLAPPTLNAAQLKHLISQCRYFIGARTHATIAAFSTVVPTVSIAYSVKAKGINRDLFGHIDYVLDTPKVTAQALHQHLQVLRTQETTLKAQLAQVMPAVRIRSQRAATHMLAALGIPGKAVAP